MGPNTVWKIAAVVFAGLTAFLLWRDASRDAESPGPPVVSPVRASAPAPRAPRRAADPPPPPSSSEEAADSKTPLPSVAQPATPQQTPSGSAEELLIAIASSPDTNAWMQRLRPRRDEVLPLLERLVRESQSAARCGVSLDTLFSVYAQFAGAAALPLLEQKAAADTAAMAPAVAAICWVDDPEAVAVVRRLQSRLSGEDMGVDPFKLAQSRRLGFRELVREWAENPPANQPWLRNRARDGLWHNAGPEFKEWVWSTATPEDRERLLSWVHVTSPAPWPDRLRASVKDGLASDDPKRRALAAYRVAESPALFDDDTYSAAKNVVSADAPSAGGDAVGQLRHAKERFAAEDARREREAGLRAILDGR